VHGIAALWPVLAELSQDDADSLAVRAAANVAAAKEAATAAAAAAPPAPLEAPASAVPDATVAASSASSPSDAGLPVVGAPLAPPESDPSELLGSFVAVQLDEGEQPENVEVSTGTP
jgi:hypothetical protein